MTKYVFCLFVLLGFIQGCTDNQAARSWGGETTVNLPRGQHLVLVTWKEEDLWYLTRPLHDDEEPETYTFHEQSSWGVLEGTVHLVESR